MLVRRGKPRAISSQHNLAAGGARTEGRVRAVIAALGPQGAFDVAHIRNDWSKASRRSTNVVRAELKL
jgi:hypothetical protein